MLGQQLGDIQAKGLETAYQQAAQRGVQLGQLGLGALQQGIGGSQALGQLGTAEQASNLQRLQAQAATGAEQRAMEQQRLDQAYADFLRQRETPTCQGALIIMQRERGDASMIAVVQREGRLKRPLRPPLAI